MAFTKKNIRDIKESAVHMISDDWALVTAGTENDYNTMTVSWGGIGELWGKDVCFIFIRPQRYTLPFLEKNERFTMSFFGGEYKKELTFCGRVSGKDADKAKETGLSPVFDGDTTYFDEATVVLKCRKMAEYELTPDGFLDAEIGKNYVNGDYHKVFIAEIEETLVK